MNKMIVLALLATVISFNATSQCTPAYTATEIGDRVEYYGGSLLNGFSATDASMRLLIKPVEETYELFILYDRQAHKANFESFYESYFSNDKLDESYFVLNINDEKLKFVDNLKVKEYHNASNIGGAETVKYTIEMRAPLSKEQLEILKMHSIQGVDFNAGGYYSRKTYSKEIKRLIKLKQSLNCLE